MQSTQQDPDACDARNRPCLREAALDSGETRVVHCGGFARALPADGGNSGPSFQLLRALHEHHQHHHQCVLPAASATAERVFSLRGLTLSDLRKSLLEGTVKVIMWAKWESPSIPL